MMQLIGPPHLLTGAGSRDRCVCMSEEPSRHQPSRVAITADDVGAWEKEIAENKARIDSLTARNALLGKRIELASDLFGLMSDGDLWERPVSEETKTKIKAKRVKPEHITEDTSFVDAIRILLTSVKWRTAPHELKALLQKTPLAGRINENDKAFYTAIGRLAERGEIIRHNGWLLSPTGYDDYMKAVESGAVKDEPMHPPSRQSPMGDEIQKIIAGNPGIESKGIIAKLRSHPEFAAAIDPNTTIAYNIIARLVNRRIVVKRGKQLYLAGSAPTDLLNGAPSAPERENPGVGPGVPINSATDMAGRSPRPGGGGT